MLNAFVWTDIVNQLESCDCDLRAKSRISNFRRANGLDRFYYHAARCRTLDSGQCTSTTDKDKTQPRRVVYAGYQRLKWGRGFGVVISSFFLLARVLDRLTPSDRDTYSRGSCRPLPKLYPALSVSDRQRRRGERRAERSGGRRRGWPPISRSTPGLASPR